MKKNILLASIVSIIVLSSCKHQKYQMYNMMPMMVDVSDYVNDGDYSADSCRHRLNRLIRTKPLVLDQSHEVILQLKLKNWKNNYNRWLKANGRDTINIDAGQLFDKTSYQYSYMVTDKPVDVYRTDTHITVNGIRNMHFYLQLNQEGVFISDYDENNYMDTRCDSINARYQDIYSKDSTLLTIKSKPVVSQ